MIEQEPHFLVSTLKTLILWYFLALVDFTRATEPAPLATIRLPLVSSLMAVTPRVNLSSFFSGPHTMSLQVFMLIFRMSPEVVPQ